MDGLGMDGTGYDANGDVCLGGGVLEGVSPVPSTCATGHEGTLCQACQAGYGRSGEDGCTPCEDGASLNKIAQVIAMVLVACFCGSLLLIGLSFAIGDVYENEDDQPAKGQDTRRVAFNNPINENIRLSVIEDSGPAPTPPPRMLQDTDRPNSIDAQQKVTPTQGPQRISMRAIIRSSKRLLLSGTALSIQPLKLLISCEYYCPPISSLCGAAWAEDCVPASARQSPASVPPYSCFSPCISHGDDFYRLSDRTISVT
jgi:hypothetical protein